MFRRDRPSAAADFSELTGDPWATGIINDSPSPEERQHWAERYDEDIALKLAHAGVAPGHPHYEYLHQEASNLDMTHSVSEPMRHGHELPMRKRDALLYAPESVWRHEVNKAANADALMAEYARREPELAQDLEGLSAAIDVALEYAESRNERPMDNPRKFLDDVAAFHRSGARSYTADSHRTSGIGTGSGGYAPATDYHPNDDDDGVIGDLRAIQRKGGFY